MAEGRYNQGIGALQQPESNGQFLVGCKITNAQHHPARFPAKLPEFFIRMLTQPGDLVLDIFAGSNTTGQVAEIERRRWLAFELSREYVATSAFRFLNGENTSEDMVRIYKRVLAGDTVNIASYVSQGDLLSTAFDR